MFGEWNKLLLQYESGDSRHVTFMFGERDTNQVADTQTHKFSVWRMEQASLGTCVMADKQAHTIQCSENGTCNCQLVPCIGKSLRKSTYLVEYFPYLETEDLLPCSQLPETEPPHELPESNPLPTHISLRYLVLSSYPRLWLFSWSSPTKIVYTLTNPWEHSIRYSHSSWSDNPNNIRWKT
jgi:hypothetical protein